MIYRIPPRDRLKLNRAPVTDKLKGLTEVLMRSYEILKQLATKSSLRRSQLVLYRLSTEIHHYYLQLAGRILTGEKRPLQPSDPFPGGEWRVIPFNREKKPDNNVEIVLQSKEVRDQLEQAYDELLGGELLDDEEKNVLKEQHASLTVLFLKLNTDACRP